MNMNDYLYDPMDYCDHKESDRVERTFHRETLTVSEKCSVCGEVFTTDFKPIRIHGLEAIFESYAKLGFFTTHPINLAKSPVGNKYWESSTEAIFQAYVAGRIDGVESRNDTRSRTDYDYRLRHILGRMEGVQNLVTDVSTLKDLLDVYNTIIRTQMMGKSFTPLTELVLDELLRKTDLSSDPSLDLIRKRLDKEKQNEFHIKSN